MDVRRSQRSLEVPGRHAGVPDGFLDDLSPCSRGDFRGPAAPRKGQDGPVTFPLVHYGSDGGFLETQSFGDEFVAFAGLVNLDDLFAHVFGNLFGAWHFGPRQRNDTLTANVNDPYSSRYPL